MKRPFSRVLLLLGGLTIISLLAGNAATAARDAVYSSSHQQPQRSTRLVDQLVGKWQLMTRTVTRSDGATVVDPVLGEKPLGRLHYDASGQMMLQMMRTGRATAITTPTVATKIANPRIALGYDAYFGKYQVDERAQTITHHVDGSLFPEDLGKDFVRPFTLDGDTLTLRFTSAADGAEITRTLVFRRMR